MNVYYIMSLTLDTCNRTRCEAENEWTGSHIEGAHYYFNVFPAVKDPAFSWPH